MTTIAFDVGFEPMIAFAAFGALAIISLVALRAWRDWITLKRDEIAASRAVTTRDPASEMPHIGIRLEIASVKERLRKLEAIAAGVDP